MMEMMQLSWMLLLCSLSFAPCSSSDYVFYVKPTVPTTECPSGDSPCHSLQYYANHSSFTNNSRFLFLEGEHHLDSVVTVSNVANLSLVGASSGVEILCMSLPSGFHIEEFIGVKIENMVISYCCAGPRNVTVELVNGSEVMIDHLSVSSGSGAHCTVLWVEDVVGSLSIINLIVYRGNLFVNYSHCKIPTLVNFTNNTVKGTLFSDCDLGFVVGCSNVQIVITDTAMDLTCGLNIDFNTSTSNNSVVISNFSGSVKVATSENNLQFGSTCARSEDPALCFESGAGNTVIIENSIPDVEHAFAFSPYVSIDSTQTTLRNVTLAHSFTTAGVLTILHATVILVDCTFEWNTLSAIQALGSNLIFQGTNEFKNNYGNKGAGMVLFDSFMYLLPYTHILFENNHAFYAGGAIYTINPYKMCFFSIVSQELIDTIRVTFMQNTAFGPGSSLYGTIDYCCKPIYFECPCYLHHFYDIFNISNTETDPSAIASEPYGVCLCNDDKKQPDCSLPNLSIHAHPGEKFSVRLAVVSTGPFYGAVPGIIDAEILDFNAILEPSQKSQISNTSSCKVFNYTVHSSMIDETVNVLITARNSISMTIDVYVHLMECPLGFPLSPTQGKCQCDPAAYNYDVECNINSHSFWRSANSRTWIGFIDKSSNASSKPGVMYHPNCPIGYCSRRDVNITSNTSDNQCQPHRTGLLCGECEEGYSLTLGNGKCAQCSNTHLLLILPLALSGLFLVAILFALNLTVTEGSINGLIFYANIIEMNHAVLLSGGTSYFHTFLAWISLDIGISTCLFNGMDAYSEIWLQFVFPVYLWMIILVIILFYRKSPSLANRLGGENAVKVLATLLLLSYTKLQQTVVTILSFTTLEYPDGTVRHVWLYDANVEFFKGKHLYLGIAGILVLVFLIVPYTLCLAFFQQLQACSGHRLFQWVNKLKPVFDSYAGPYKDKYRFWTGMLLVARTLLLVFFTTNTEASIEFSSLIILVVSGFLLLANSNGAYKKLACNFLESFFYLQLVVFTGSLLYVNNNHGNITAVADTSFGLSLIIFLAVLVYHSLCRLRSFKTYFYRLKGYDGITEKEMSFNHDRANN